MMKLLMILMMTLTLNTATGNTKSDTQINSQTQVCEFMPENDLWIGEHTLMGNGITEEVFDGVLDNLDKHYKPIFAERGLELNSLWFSTVFLL